MNRQILRILLYLIIVLASIFIVFKRYLLLDNEDGKTWMNYAILIAFILFTYINLRVLIKLIKEYKK